MASPVRSSSLMTTAGHPRPTAGVVWYVAPRMFRVSKRVRMLFGFVLAFGMFAVTTFVGGPSGSPHAVRVVPRNCWGDGDSDSDKHSNPQAYKGHGKKIRETIEDVWVARYTSIDNAEFQASLRKPEYTFLDVRLPHEQRKSGIPLVRNPKKYFTVPIDFKEWPFNEDDWLYEVKEAIPDKSSHVVTLCSEGVRSKVAAMALEKGGYKVISELVDGIRDYRDQGLPMQPVKGHENSFVSLEHEEKLFAQCK